VNDKLVWLLKKPVYGLCDTTKRWNNTISVFIESIGGRKSMSDPAMFYWSQRKTNILGAHEKCVSWEDFKKSEIPSEIQNDIKRGKVYGCCTIHVDDLLICGSDSFIQWATDKIFERFQTKDFSENDVKYLGMKIVRENDGSVTLDSQNYEDQIIPVLLTAERKCEPESALNDQEEANFRASLGKLMWIARLTRPDVAFEAAACAQKYEDGIALEQDYVEGDEDAQNNISQQKVKISTYLEETNDDTTHMQGFQEDPSEDVNKINIYKQKKEKPEVRHLKIKNAIFE